MKLDRPKKIVRANSQPCSNCKKKESKGKRLMFDDYAEELLEYQMDVPGSYQGAGVWGGTGNFGLGGTKQIANQKLNKATKKVADYEVNLDLADQRDDDDFEDEYAEEQLKKMEKKFMDSDIVPEAYPNFSTRPGTGTTFANLPGWPAPNTLAKKVDFIPDDDEQTEEENMKHREEEWLDHLMSQSQTSDKARDYAKQQGIEMKDKAGLTNKPSKVQRNYNTTGNNGSEGSLIAAKKFVPDELDQYKDKSEDMIWTIGKRNIY